jgi:DUF1680 family protein
MNRRNFLTAATSMPLLATNASSSLSLFPAAESAPSDPRAVDQPIRTRYELTLRRTLTGTSPAYTEDFLLADIRTTPGRRFTEYSGDLSGRYVGALATGARIYRSTVSGLDVLVDKIVALQKPDGYFGDAFHYDKLSDNDLALLWGNGRLLVGLVEYYRYRPSPPVLDASRRLGDFLVRIAPVMLSQQTRDAFGAAHFASSYICWMQQSEGLANLFILTKDARYKDLAERIAAVTERRPGDHVHGYLTALRGIMDLHAATGDAQFLHQCENAWQDIVQSPDLLVTGGVPEGWSPNKHRTEGCAEADWVRFNLQLWSATTNPKYLSAAEKAIFNEFACNQFSSGDYGHRVLTDTGFQGDGAIRAWWCCTLHGLRCFPDFQTVAFRRERRGVSYDLPIDSWIETPDFAAKASSSLAHDGVIRITVTHSEETAQTVRVRKPDWAKTLTININNSPIQAPLDGDYAVVHRLWRPGDVITVTYGMSFRSEPSGQERVAFFHGPWLLGASAAENPLYFSDLTRDNRCLPATHIAHATSPEGVQSPSASVNASREFTVPIAATALTYIPAEFPDSRECVILRAVAEQTAQLPTSWELRFATADSK